MSAINYRELRNYFRTLLIPGIILEANFAFEDRPFKSGNDMYVEESVSILNEDKQFGGDSTSMQLLFTYNVIHRDNKNANRIEDIEDLRDSMIGVFNAIKSFQLSASGNSVSVIEYVRRPGVNDSRVGARFSPIDVIATINKEQ